MEEFDARLRAMAQREVCTVPDGFDGRIRDTLGALPPRTKKRVHGAARLALIAAAACVLLAGSALAASPGLRELLAEALGGFAPYAQEQEGGTYVIDGIAFRVTSVLADDFTVRAYIEARDPEGDRLSRLAANETGAVFGLVDVPDTGSSEGMGGFVTGGTCLGYDEATKTALLSVTSWGQVLADDLSGAEVRLFDLNAGPGHQVVWENTEGVAFPVDVKPIPSLSMGPETELASALQAEEVRISSLGLSVIFKGDDVWPRFAGADVSARLTDGTLVEAPWEGGQGNYGAYGTETERKVLVWNFREPVEVDQIEGIYIGEQYFPVK